MKNSVYLKFKRIQIISLKEKKAFQTKIGKKVTVIRGGNSAGKSTLIKSLYGVFGVEMKVSNKWRKANPIILLEFSAKGTTYLILRTGTTIGLFNLEHELLELFENKPLKLAKYFSKIFDYQIELPTTDYELVIPPLNYLFLPYYIDQDDGWSKNWNSLKNRVIKRSRKKIIPYHAGIKTNREFLLQTELRKLEKEARELDEERKIINKILNRTDLDLKKISINSSLDNFKSQVDELLVLSNKLSLKREDYIYDLSNYQNLRIELSEQIKVAEKALSELKKDYEFALLLKDEEIECPTCGIVHENSFIHRFQLIQEESEIIDSLNNLHEQNRKLELKTEKLKKYLSTNEKEYDEVTNILNEKKGKIVLKDIIENEGKKSMQLNLRIQLDEMTEKLGKVAAQRQTKTENLKHLKLKKIEKIKEIKKDYLELMNKFLMSLKIYGTDPKDYKEITSNIVNNEIGNKVPRMLLSYFFAFFHLMKKHSSTIYCPIVIDSPNQQAPDKENLKNIIEFVFKNLPPDCQSIIGLEETLGIEYEGETIELEKGKGLLNEEMYEEVLKNVEPLLFQINNNRRASLL